MAKTTEKTKTKLKVGDEVVVIAGKNRNSRGKILAISRRSSRVLVQGVNLRKRFARPTQENPKGGVIEAEAPLHISNVAIYDSKNKKGSRIKAGADKNGRKIRVAVKSDKAID